MTVQEKVSALRHLMKRERIDAYIVPTADYHQSEYVGEHFKARAYLTGFTGSAGTAVITETEACLWTDGRYFLQAADQLQESGIMLQKMGEPGVPTIKDYLESVLNEGAMIGFDGRTVGIQEGKTYQKIAEKKHGKVIYEKDLVGEIWADRPPLSNKPAFALDLKYAGETTAEKLKKIRKDMAKKNATMQLFASLDDIDWILNIRGRDVEYFPLMLSYAIVKMDEVELYADANKFDADIRKGFEENGVHIYPYQNIYRRVKEIRKDETVLLDPEQVNYALFCNIPPEVKTIEEPNPVILMKAVKNETEVENIRRAHIRDGVAVTKFMYWLKTHVGKETITELSASDKLESFRAEQAGFICPSFDPICAYKEHGAIVHYSSSPETDVELKPEGLFLTDTGGNYWEGSTDITRTIALGELTQEEKDHFTLVAISMLNLADVRFLYGCTGMNLDYVAREPFWRLGLNFNHGTGHGVGYLGNIHEPPQRFNWKYSKDGAAVLEKNMVITDEPGIYIENSHGIRTENELLVCEGEKNEYGQFMHFEHITFVPIDLDAVNPELMTEREIRLLNTYHKQVFEQISPYLNEEEKTWLRIYTRSI